MQQLFVITISLLNYSTAKRSLGFSYKAYDDDYVIPVPVPDKNKSYLIANTVAITLFSGLFLSVIVSIYTVSKSIVVEQKKAEERLKKKEKLEETKRMSEVKELVKDGSESEGSSARGSDRLRSVISPEMLQTNNL